MTQLTSAPANSTPTQSIADAPPVESLPHSHPPAGAPASAQKLKTFSSLRHRNFQLYLGGQLVSLAGTWMQSVAQGWLVYQLSGSEATLGIVGFAAAIPALVVTPWPGSSSIASTNASCSSRRICLDATGIHPVGAHLYRQRSGLANRLAGNWIGYGECV